MAKLSSGLSITIKGRLIALGLITVAGFASLVAVGWYSGSRTVEAAREAETLRENIHIINEMRLANIELVLAAMDSIIDKSEGKLLPERQETIDTSIIEDNPFFCPDASKIPEMEAYMKALGKEGNSVGAKISVIAEGVPPGLGEPIFDRLDAELAALMAAFVDVAEAHAATVMPGFTHLQSAQPVTFGHHCLAYVAMLARDRGRFADARARLNESPLGAAALAGTAFPIDRTMTALALGFDGPQRNSLDAVSARDFALEALAADPTRWPLDRDIVGWVVERLDERGFDGDADLVEVLPDRVPPDLAPVPVNPEDLALALTGSETAEFHQVLHRTTGVLTLVETGDELEAMLDDRELLHVVGFASRNDGWWDMAEFIERVEDGELADRLLSAINGKGAFRRFADLLHRPEHADVLTRWTLFRDERQLGRARSWLAAHGLRPTPPSPDRWT